MRKFGAKLLEVLRKGDMVLLALCVLTSVFGIVMVAASTAYDGSSRYVIIQTGALITGILLYLALTAFDIDSFAPAADAVPVQYCLSGHAARLGRRGYVRQQKLAALSLPAVQYSARRGLQDHLYHHSAKTMSLNRNRISSLRSVGTLTFHMLWIVALIVVISHDTGVALIFMFLFVVMAYVGGVSGWWFLGGAGAVAAVSPYLWKYFIRDDQKQRILALIDPSIDPDGLGVLWQTNKSLEALRNGGLTGQGLFHGDLTSIGYLPAQHTDSIFSSIGEQLGMLGCLAALFLLLAIVLRCIQVGMKSPDYMNRLICIGIASMLLFQILINVGVCLGLFPVVGLALPFLSYGGSSILTSFLAMGIVSGIKMRPAPDMSAHYIRPY